MAKRLPEITLIKDTREQNGWFFGEEEKRPGKVRILGTKDFCLDAGDYSIEGMEDVVRIERKNGFGELFGNYAPKEHNERFLREMGKLSTIPYSYILIETTLNADTLGLGVPQIKNGPPAKRVLDWLIGIQLEYGVNIMFVGDAGKDVAKNIFKRVARIVS